MLFTSYGFLLFLAVLLVLYYLIPGKLQWMLLLVASYVFYAIAGPLYLPYLVAVTLITYFAARIIGKRLAEQNAYLAEHKAALSREEKKEYKALQKKNKSFFLL